MLEKICEYLSEKGLNVLFDNEYEAILELIQSNQKISAIKALREYTRCGGTKEFQLLGFNSFSTWLEAHGKDTYEVNNTLGLKEAKDIIDFLIANPGPAGL